MKIKDNKDYYKTNERLEKRMHKCICGNKAFKIDVVRNELVCNKCSRIYEVMV